jgi:hypothetical protein
MRTFIIAFSSRLQDERSRTPAPIAASYIFGTASEAPKKMSVRKLVAASLAYCKRETNLRKNKTKGTRQ